MLRLPEASREGPRTQGDCWPAKGLGLALHALLGTWHLVRGTVDWDGARGLECGHRGRRTRNSYLRSQSFQRQRRAREDGARGSGRALVPSVLPMGLARAGRGPPAAMEEIPARGTRPRSGGGTALEARLPGAKGTRGPAARQAQPSAQVSPKGRRRRTLGALCWLPWPWRARPLSSLG